MNNRFYGNERALQTLTAAIEGGRLCHAYLIEGEDGTGKTAFAKRFASAVLCTGKSHRPCGNCNACYKTQHGSHPDLHLYTEDSKNKVDFIRRIKEDVYTLPNDGEYKVYIICRAEELTIEAQNALLKMLEEPPEDTVFLLTCRNRSALANTVVSRCVPIGLSTVSEAECAEALLSEDTDADTAMAMAEQFHGNIGLALEAMADDSYREEQTRRQAILEAILQGSEYRLLKALSAYENKKGKDAALNGMLDCLIAVFRDLLAIKSEHDTFTGPFPELSKQLSNKLSTGQGMRLLQLTQETKQLFKYNVNIPLTLLDFGGKIKEIIS